MRARRDGSIVLYDLVRKRELRRLSPGTMPHAIRFDPTGTRLAIVSHFDNSPNNPLNPDPTKVVRWGEASEMEMMDGWIEYVDKDLR